MGIVLSSISTCTRLAPLDLNRLIGAAQPGVRLFQDWWDWCDWCDWDSPRRNTVKVKRITKNSARLSSGVTYNDVH